MDLTEVVYDVGDRVATITINRPERRNALRETTIRELLAAFSAARADPSVGAVVLTGAGDRAFSAGADLSGFASESTDIERHFERAEFVDLFLAVDRLGKPTIAAVNGAALAGGLGLALSCDLVVAAESATFGTPEIGVGLWPMMVMAIVGRNLPRKRAVQLYTTGERIDARTAYDWGMVNRVVPLDDVVPSARELARSLAAKSPLIMRLGLEALRRIDGMDHETALRHLQAQLTIVTLSEDSEEGVAAFLEKREPDFRGR